MKAITSVALLLSFALSDAQTPVPLDPLPAVIAAFDRVNLVGLGERHWSLEDSHFRLRLIRDPRFAERVNDIVIEFANPRHQALLDRFVAGDEVPHDVLSKVWQDTTQRYHIWDSPIYEELISTLRSVNAGLPPARRLRVVAGDYPVDVVNGPPGQMINRRDLAATNIIQREVLDKHRKALVIFGAGHLYLNNSQRLVNMVSQDVRAKWFVVIPLGGYAYPEPIARQKATSATPVLLMTTGMVGDLDGADLGWTDKTTRTTVREIADACLYFGTARPVLVRPAVPQN